MLKGCCLFPTTITITITRVIVIVIAVIGVVVIIIVIIITSRIPKITIFFDNLTEFFLFVSESIQLESTVHHPAVVGIIIITVVVVVVVIEVVIGIIR